MTGGRQWTYASGLHIVAAAWTPEGGVHLFGFGDWHGAEDLGQDAFYWLIGLDGEGTVTSADAVGQTREDEGAFAISPDGAVLAIAHHRDTVLYDRIVRTGRPDPKAGVVAAGDRLATICGGSGRSRPPPPHRPPSPDRPAPPRPPRVSGVGEGG